MSGSGREDLIADALCRLEAVAESFSVDRSVAMQTFRVIVVENAVESYAMRLRALGKFGLFVFLFLIAGKGLDRILPLIHFPDRAFTWNVLLANDLLDFAFVALLAWVMSVIFRERFSSYGLPGEE